MADATYAMQQVVQRRLRQLRAGARPAGRRQDRHLERQQVGLVRRLHPAAVDRRWRCTRSDKNGKTLVAMHRASASSARSPAAASRSGSGPTYMKARAGRRARCWSSPSRLRRRRESTRSRRRPPRNRTPTEDDDPEPDDDAQPDRHREPTPTRTNRPRPTSRARRHHPAATGRRPPGRRTSRATRTARTVDGARARRRDRLPARAATRDPAGVPGAGSGRPAREPRTSRGPGAGRAGGRADGPQQPVDAPSREDPVARAASAVVGGPAGRRLASAHRLLAAPSRCWCCLRWPCSRSPRRAEGALPRAGLDVAGPVLARLLQRHPGAATAVPRWASRRPADADRRASARAASGQPPLAVGRDVGRCPASCRTPAPDAALAVLRPVRAAAGGRCSTVGVVMLAVALRRAPVGRRAPRAEPAADHRRAGLLPAAGGGAGSRALLAACPRPARARPGCCSGWPSPRRRSWRSSAWSRCCWPAGTPPTWPAGSAPETGAGAARRRGAGAGPGVRGAPARRARRRAGRRLAGLARGGPGLRLDLAGRRSCSRPAGRARDRWWCRSRARSLAAGTAPRCRWLAVVLLAVLAVAGVRRSPSLAARRPPLAPAGAVAAGRRAAARASRCRCRPRCCCCR